MRNFVIAAAMAAMVFGCQQMQGPPGDKGDKGDPGLAGPQGLRGEKGDSVIADTFGKECKTDGDCADADNLVCDKQAKVCRLETAAEHRADFNESKKRMAKATLEIARETLANAKKACSEEKVMCGESLTLAHTSVKEAEERVRKAGALAVAAPKAKSSAETPKKPDDKSGSKGGDEPLAGKVTALEGRTDALETRADATDAVAATARANAGIALAKAEGKEAPPVKEAVAAKPAEKPTAEAIAVAIDEARLRICVAGTIKSPFFAEEVRDDDAARKVKAEEVCRAKQAG